MTLSLADRQQLKAKPKKCPACGNDFVPHTTTQRICRNLQCAIDWTAIQQARREERQRKQERREYRAAKQALMTVRDWIPRAEAAVHPFIKLRDADDPCVSCGAPADSVDFNVVGGGWDAGHYLAKGLRPAIRFHEDNIHKQCKKCNSQRNNPARRAEIDAAYRVNLIKKIGIERVEWLEGPHPPAKYTIPDLQYIITTYRAKTRELRKERA